MKLNLLLLATTAIGSSLPQIYLSPSPPSISHSQRPLSLTAPQANAILAHNLGVSQYERLPPSASNVKGGNDWKEALATSNLGEGEGPKMIILMECPRAGCKDLIPETFENSRPYNLPNLPLQSWTSVITLHLHRLVTSLGLDLDSPQVKGLDTFVEAIKSVEGWMGWVGEELGSRIGWDKIKQTAKAAVEPDFAASSILTDLDFASTDASAKTLVMEIEELSTLADSFSSRQTDDGPQSSSPEVVAIHLKGMKAIANAHRPGSASYERAALIARQTLAATIAAFNQASSSSSSSSSSPRVILLALPPYSPPLLRKRSAWLKPFTIGSSSAAKYNRRTSQPSSKLSKRALLPSELDADLDVDNSLPVESEEGKVKFVAGATRTPIVTSSKTCFESAEDANNQTVNCLGRGVPVQGVTVKGGECWVCSCGKTEENGRTKSWAGEGCEKEDLSSDFVLLFFSGAGLLVVLLVSVMLLAKVGSEELPGTLAGVTGAGGSKRD